MFPKLNDENFIMFAMKNYENPACTGFSEFKEDIHRIKYIKRLLLRYVKTGKIKERLILNHIIILGNVYGPLNVSRILFFKLPPNLYSPLRSFLDFLKYTPSHINEVDIKKIVNDPHISEKLKQIK